MNRAFYYWQTTAPFKDSDVRYFRENKIKSLYVRFFDVSWDEETQKPFPVSTITFPNLPNKNENNSGDLDEYLGIRIVPVVFITQNVLEKLEIKNIDPLGQNIAHLISSIAKKYKLTNIDEIQMDSDWTFNTRGIYFGLIKKVKEHYQKIQNDPQNPGNKINPNSPVCFSATIRLHQVKFFRETGIPPVDRGTLMVYSTGSIYDFTEKNSILDVPTAKGYLKNLDHYPLPLDIALPMFSWAIQYDSNKKFIRIIQDINVEDLTADKNYQPIENHTFQAVNDTMLHEKRIMKDDIIRVEDVTINQVTEISTFIKSKLKTKNTPNENSNEISIIMFHYNPHLMEVFTHGKPEKVFDLFNIF